MEFSRPEYWSEQPFPSPGDLPNPLIKPRSPTLQADSLPAKPQVKPKNSGVVAYPFSSGSSQLRNQTGVSCIAGGFFTDWAIREVSLKFLLIRLSINILINITKENLGTASAWGTAVVSIWFGFIHSTFSPKSTLTYFQGLPPQIFRWHYCSNTRLFPLSMMLWLKTFTFFLC